MAKRVFTQTFGVVGAIIERDGKFLLMREAGRKGPDAGKWSHPAGWIDVGENPVAAVQREAQEESGFGFTPTHILGVYSLVRHDIRESETVMPHAIKLIFAGTVNGTQQALADDSAETRWFTSEEIAAMDGATLRDVDIKLMVKDYLAGKRYPLDLITHTVQK